MPHLQLADNNEIELTPQNFYGDVTTLAQNDPKELYIFVPAGYRGATEDMYVREDALDNLPQAEFEQVMFDLEDDDGMLSGKADRQRRRERRQFNKRRKQDTKAEKRATRGGGARRSAKEARIARRQEGKTSRKGMGGGAFDKILGVAGDIFGKGDAPIAVQGDFEYSTPDSRAGIMDQGNGNGDLDETFWDKNKMPIIIGGVALAGLGLFLATRKKKK